MFLNDQETATDLLYYEAIAKTVVKLIRDTPNAPITIGVHGDWGAGKSSVLRMTEATLKQDSKVLCLWFNGWTFEGFEDAKTVVIETVIDELQRARPGSTKVADAAKKLLKRVDWLKLAKKAGGFAVTAVTGIPTLGQLKDLRGVAEKFLAKPEDLITRDDIKEATKSVSEYIKDAPQSADHLPEHLHAFRKEFKELIEAAEIDQLVIIVDDLDRCLPATSIATLEAIRLFLFVEKTAFVIGADELMIEYAVREHFPDLPPSSGPISYARNYLEKLIQVPFRIPALGAAETRAYITLLLIENHLGSGSAEFRRLLEIVREDMKRPWKSSGLGSDKLRGVFTSGIPAEVSQSLTVAEHLTRILSDGTRGNPRQIKRFLNSLMLRQAVADARGFGADIQRPMLAKIMLAERFYPEFYEQVARIASTSPDGKIDLLSRLESAIQSEPTAQTNESKSGKVAKKDSESTESNPTEVADWLKNEWVRGWLSIEPKLSGIDLRAYFFVTRDKRVFIGGALASNHLESLVDKLMGSALHVSSQKSEFAKLTAPEKDQVFDAVRQRILQQDSFTERPKGCDALIMMVQEHTAFQQRLFDFITALPEDKIGGWVASSFGACFKDTQIKAQFDARIKTWSETSENAKLKAAATALLSLKK